MTTMAARALAITSTVLLLLVGGCAKLGGRDESGTSGAARQGPALEGTRWTLVAIGDKPAEITAEQSGGPYVQLNSEDQSVTGSTGVNFLSGKYTLRRGALRFGPLITTRRAGPPALMQQETDFTRALERTAHWQVREDGELELLDADRKPLAQFRAATSRQ
jgi:heat shock protein HslJ